MVIRVRGVKVVRSKGRLYYYHRKTMTRLPGQPGTTVFMDRLSSLEARNNPLNPLPGTLGALIAAYRGSPEFSCLADRTRAGYQEAFDYFKPLDRMPLAIIDGSFLYELRNKAAGTRKRFFANYLVRSYG